MRSRPPLSYNTILAWADEHFERTGAWPNRRSEVVRADRHETWAGIEGALREGKRGLQKGDSLARLFARERGRFHPRDRVCLSNANILKWADAYYKRTGRWPVAASGPIPEAPGETWKSIAKAMSRGTRGMTQGSLAALMATRRGARRQYHLKPLTEVQILTYVLEHLARTGDWPNYYHGVIPRSGGEKWWEINSALREGRRGLPASGSLTDFLAAHFGQRVGSLKTGRFTIVLPFRAKTTISRLTEGQIVRWAEAHHKQHGVWPRRNSGAIAETLGETWSIIDSALIEGSRGLQSGSSLSKLLGKHGFIRARAALPELTEEKIVQWATEHYERTRRWPGKDDKIIPNSGGETWTAVRVAARNGTRGLPGIWTLVGLLKERGLKTRRTPRPELKLDDIREWMRRFRRQHGRWPRGKDGAISGVEGETWAMVQAALSAGIRGLPKGHTLYTLEQEMEMPDRMRSMAPLKIQTVELWLRAFYRRHDRWPSPADGKISDAPGETWAGVDEALRRAWRRIRFPTSLNEVISRTQKPRPFG